MAATRSAPMVLAEPFSSWAASARPDASPEPTAERSASIRLALRQVNVVTNVVSRLDPSGARRPRRTSSRAEVVNTSESVGELGLRLGHAVVLGGPRGSPPGEDVLQRLELDRLGDVVVHSRGQATLAVRDQRAGGQGDDRGAAAPASRAGGSRSVAAKPSITGMWQSIRIAVVRGPLGARPAPRRRCRPCRPRSRAGPPGRRRPAG